jgi:hypothetical protein
MSIETMKLALEALEHVHSTGDTQVFDMCYANKVIPALRAAIEQAERNQFNPDWDQLEACKDCLREHMAEIQRLRGLLEQAEKQEPVAWFTEDHREDKSATTYSEKMSERWKEKGWPVTPLYTAPPQRTWQGLTPEEVKEISLANRPYVVDMVVALEARLKEKNGY